MHPAGRLQPNQPSGARIDGLAGWARLVPAVLSQHSASLSDTTTIGSRMSGLAQLSMRNRALIALVTVFVMIFGVITTTQLKQELIPSIDIPTAFVSTSYAGASPEVVEQSVTIPIEQAVLGVTGLDSTSSTSSTGQSQVTVNLVYGTNMSTAQQDLQAAVSRIKSVLPDGVDPQVITGSIEDFPVLQLSVTGDASRTALSERLTSIAVPDLQKIDGVRAVTVAGAPDQRVQIDLDTDKLKDRGYPVSAVTDALQANASVTSAGTLSSGHQSLSVNVGTRLTSAAQIAKIALVPPASSATQASSGQGNQTGQASSGQASSGQASSGQASSGQAAQTGQAAGADPAGAPSAAKGDPPVPTTPLPNVVRTKQARPTTIGEVAKVTDTTAPATSISRTNGKDSLSLAITKTPAGNTVAVSDAVRAALPQLGEKLGGNVEFTTVFDQAPFITQSIDDLLSEGGLGLVMAIVVILIFLLSVRSTLVTAISIPVSVLITMIGLRVADYSLNILTLGALTIAIGRVVDDSIVVIENIKRHLSYGEAKQTAILTAVREVATAITAATLTTVAVFLPIALVGGQTGQLFRPFAVTATLALASSLLVALTIVPVLAYWFLPSPKGTVDPAQVREAAETKERRSLLQRGYVPLIGRAIAHPVIVLSAAVLILGGTAALAPQLKFDYLGNSGQNTLTVQQQFAPSVSLDEKSDQAVKVERALTMVPGVQTLQTTVGSAGGAQAAFTGASSDSATFSITTDTTADQQGIEAAIRQQLNEVTGAGQLTVSAQNSGFGTQSVQVIVNAPDAASLSEGTSLVLARMQKVPGASDVTSSLEAAQPLVQVSVDQEKAAKKSVTDTQISQALTGILAPAKVGTVVVGGENRDIVLKTRDAPIGLTELRAIEVVSQTGKKVKIGDIASVTRTKVSTQISRDNSQRSATVSLTPDGDNLRTVNADVTAGLADLQLPTGVETTLGGVSSDQTQAFSQLGLALLVAIAIVYVVMVATFKSLIQPLILLVSVPFAAVGALLALLITGTALSVPSLIGVLMLVGIVVTNAIVLIDLVNRYRNEGQSVNDALVNGARQRLRPILMTAVATIFALIPMALGLTGGGVFISQPLAVVVIGGLVSSTVLTLIIVPVLYRLVEGRREQRELRRIAVREEELARHAV